MTSNAELVHRTVNYSLRSPRIAIVVPDLPKWQFIASLVLEQASITWGGAGFILIPHKNGLVEDLFLRIANKYDPDHVVSIKTFYSELMEVMPDMFLPIMLDGRPVSPDVLRSQSIPPFFSIMHEDELAKEAVASACSPFRIYSDIVPNGLLAQKYLSESATPEFLHDINSSLEIIDLPVSSLDLLTSDLSVLKMSKKGKCHGYADPSVHPAMDQAMRVTLVRELFDIGSNGIQNQLLQWWGEQKWERSRTGLSPIRRGYAPEVFYIVVGDEFSDFCLFHDIDRISGASRWIPKIWLDTNSTYAPIVRELLSELAFTAVATGVKTIVISHNQDASVMKELLLQNQGNSLHVITDWSWLSSLEKSEINWREMSNRSLELNQDFDKDLVLPAYISDDGAIELVQRLPPFVPETEGFEGSESKPWIIDVAIEGCAMPTGHEFPGDNLQVATGPFKERLRSGRDGVSYMSHSFGFVFTGSTLRQSLGRPKLRIPGLLEWITFKAWQKGWKVSPSDAGQSALSCIKIWGDRESLADDLLKFGTFFREFQCERGQKSSNRYPNGDGCVLSEEGFLSFKAAERLLKSEDFDALQIRRTLDRFTQLGVLGRGLILRCPECSQTQWIKLESLQETSACQRCQGKIPLTQSNWKHPEDEPTWFYDLHPIVRKLIRNNGDVPILTGRLLHLKNKGGEILPELNFSKVGESTIEVDLIYGNPNQIVIAEAKKNPEFGSEDRNKQIDNLAKIAKLLEVNLVILSSGNQGEWTDAIKTQVERNLASVAHANGYSPKLDLLVNVRELSNS